MSRFMFIIASAGLIDSPPVSKVMPLPTSTTCGVRREARVGRVVELHQPGRVGRGLADAGEAAEAPGAQLLLVPHAQGQALVVGHLGGPVGQPDRGLLVGGHQRQRAGGPAGVGRGQPLARAPPRARPGAPARRARPAAGASGVAGLEVVAERRPSTTPSTKARSPASSASAGTVVTTRRGSRRLRGAGRAGATYDGRTGTSQVGRRRGADADQQHRQRSAVVALAAPGAQERRARRPRRPDPWPRGAPGGASRSTSTRSSSSAAPGPRTRSPSSSRNGSATHVGTRELGREVRTQGDARSLRCVRERSSTPVVVAEISPRPDGGPTPSAPASSALSSTTRRPPPSSGTRITMPRPSLVTSSGPSPVRGFIAAMRTPLPVSPACWSARGRGRPPPLRHAGSTPIISHRGRVRHITPGERR